MYAKMENELEHDPMLMPGSPDDQWSQGSGVSESSWVKWGKACQCPQVNTSRTLLVGEQTLTMRPRGLVSRTEKYFSG